MSAQVLSHTSMATPTRSDDETVLIERQSGGRRRSVSLLALPVAAAAGVVTASGAADRQLWADEYATWHAATLDLNALGHLIDNVDFLIAPYYLMMHAWIAFFGDSAASLRAPSIAAMTITAGLLFLLGNRLFNATTGVIAGVLFAVLPSVSRYAHEARPYALAIMFATLATLLLVYAIDTPSWPMWSLYGVAVLLAGAAHIVTTTILAAHLAMIWHSARRRDTLLPWRWLAPAVVIVSVIGPMAMIGSEQSGVIQWIKADQQAILSFPERLAASSIMASILVMFALVGFYKVLTSTNRGPLLLLGMWALFPPLFTLATFDQLHLFLHRYLLFTLPAWALLAGLGVDSLGRAFTSRKQAIGAGVLGVAVLSGAFWLALPGQAIARHDPMDGQPDFRGAAALILTSQKNGDGIAYAGSHDRGRRAMEYELRAAQPRDIFRARSSVDLGGFVAQECAVPVECLGDVNRIWIVNSSLGSDEFAGFAPSTVAMFRSRFTITDTKQFAGVRLALLTRRATAAP